MIQGVVNDAYEAVVAISLQGPEGQTQDIEAVIDTGYSGFLTLPAALVTELGLPFAYIGRALLANDDEVTFEVHDVTVLWDGQPRHIKSDATGSTPLVGMLLLDRHSLNIEVERGGSVVERASEATIGDIRSMIEGSMGYRLPMAYGLSGIRHGIRRKQTVPQRD